MEIIVEGTPATCLERVQEYFIKEWPFAEMGTVRREEGLVRFEEDEPAAPMFGSTGSIAVFFLLSFLTAGVFTALWFVYYLFWGMRGAYSAQVFAIRNGPSRTRLTISATNQEYADTLERWVKEALVERREAASVENGQGQALDVPDQIKKLAELRDAGVLTEEEFERKKAELLDRM